MALPESRTEHYLNAILGNESCPHYPKRTRSRKENYLDDIWHMTDEIKRRVRAMAHDMKYKGSVEDYEHLPATPHRGDVYTTRDNGKEYVWDGETWVEIGSGVVDGKEEIALTGDDGTLTPQQIADVLNDHIDVVLVNGGRVFYLADKLSSLTYRTYLSFDIATTEVITAKAIYIQLNESAVNYGRWTMEDVSISGVPTASELDERIDGTGDIVVDLDSTNNTLLIGTHAKTVTITDVPPTAEQGTLTEEQLAALEESTNSIIVFNNEIYRLNDNGHEAGTRGYSHIGVENSVFMIKNITVTLNTRGWVLTTKELN